LGLIGTLAGPPLPFGVGVSWHKDCEIGDVCILVEILGPHGSSVRVRSSAARSHIAVGLLRVAKTTVLDAYDANGPS